MGYLTNYVKSRVRKFRRRDEGQAVSEFALIAPLMIMIAVAVLLLGYFVFTQIMVVSAANQGARAGSALSVDENVSQQEMISRAQTTAESMLSSGLNLDNGNVQSQLIGNERFETTVTYEFQFPFSIPGTNIPDSHMINHTSVYYVWGEDDD
ncbi:TadE/TadG family type IV pilus assembly protein [Geomicrobium sp. JSM 1781026]|uniref:TadE/TadG family type IV pilus assembly protein n=1 Tax=Geomicrobium sp. JSM 1781026 TaxID=3344580 RepID=UPI0035C1C29B